MSLYLVVPLIVAGNSVIGYLLYKYFTKKNKEENKPINKNITKPFLQSEKSEYLTTPYRRKYRESFYDGL
tara:strand:+ start:3792 stop:4001 length:210 start_codon:yes stop_codon:yes gene_type:complete